MASLKFFNTSTNQWEIIKTDSINGVIPNNQIWTATQGQTIFSITNGSIADASLLNVYVNGKISTNYTFTNNTTFTFFTGLNSGDSVYATWFEVSVPSTIGHHSTHEVNGQDPIDITKLTNYQGQIATPIADLQDTQTNHETRITTIEDENLNSRDGSLEYAKTTDESRISHLEKPPYFHLNKNGSQQIMDGSFTYITFSPANVVYYSGITPSTNTIIVNEDGVYYIESSIQLSGLNSGIFANLFIRALNADGTLNADYPVTQIGWQGAGGNSGGVWIRNSRLLQLKSGQMIQFLYSAGESPRGIMQLIANGYKVSQI
jgi:hypothetical protein